MIKILLKKNSFSLKTPYQKIHIIVAGIIISIMIYSGIFSPQKNNHPVTCNYRQLFGKPCPTCGISRSFSAMVRGNFKQAKELNPNGPGIFFFFAIQGILRLLFLSLSVSFPTREKMLIITDIFLSLGLFIYFFQNLIFLGTV